MDELMQVLRNREDKAVEAVLLDRAIDCDAYESVGKLKLIRSIIKDVQNITKGGLA